MMDNALKLRVMFDMIDNWTKPLKNVLNSNKGLAQSLKRTRGELVELGKQQKAVASFREMRTGLTETSTKLAAAQAHIKKLAGSLRTFGPPSQQMIADLARARQAASQLRAEQKKQTASVEELRGRLAKAGIDTRNLSEHERTLRTNIAATTATMKAQTRQLEALSERERALASARGKMHAMQGVAAGMAIGGHAARSTGAHIFGDLRETLGEAKKMQNERGRITAFGLGDQATKDAEKYVRAMKMMGVSTSDNMTLMRDALSIFADEHHAQMVMPTLAKMKFANEAMFGAEDAHANEEKFMNMLKVIELRGGTKDEATFKNEANMVQRVLSATGGRVGGDEWRNFIQTGGVAAKQMRQDAFYYQMEPLIQEMGGHAVGTGLMSAYSNAYQGKTTVRAAKEMMALGLVDKKNVEYNKIGMIKRIRPGALLGDDLFKASPLEWLEKVLLPQLEKKGITDPDKVKDMISTIFTNRTAANLFSTMYMQRQQIHKNEKLNAGAYGIDNMHELASEQIPGKEVDALAKLRDLRTEIGEQVIPLYNAALEKTTVAIDRLTRFMKEHQTASKVMLTVLVIFSAVLVAVGTLTIALAGILGPLAIVRFSMTTLGMKGGLLSASFRGLAMLLRTSTVGSFKLIARSVSLLWKGSSMLALLLRSGLVRAIWLVGRALSILGQLAIAHPLLAFIGLLAMLAIYVWQHWDMLGPKFAKLWEAIKTRAQAVVDWIIEKWSMAIEWIKGKLGDFATACVHLWDIVKERAGASADWIKDRWSIAVEWVSAKVASIGGDIRDGLSHAGTSILNWSPLGLFYRVFAGVLSWFGVDLPATFTEFGVHLIDGLVDGIKSRLGALKNAIASVGDSVVDWFKTKLGIHSPSRVFAELGGFVSQGAALGMESERQRVARAALGLATAAVTSFGLPVLSATAAVAQPATVPIVRPTTPIDRRPPLAAAPASVTSATTPAPIVINIYAQAGDDPRAIARAVSAELDRREHAKRSRIGSRLSD